jgi:hypothetical protein
MPRLVERSGLLLDRRRLQENGSRVTTQRPLGQHESGRDVQPYVWPLSGWTAANTATYVELELIGHMLRSLLDQSNIWAQANSTTRRVPKRSALIFCAILYLFAPEDLSSQDCRFIHPPPAPEASDFLDQPPTDTQTHFAGPVIQMINVRCWSAEPAQPSRCVGGVHGDQKVTVFVPTSDSVDPTRIDQSFRQKVMHSFSRGGRANDLKASDLPPGIFVSFKGHPIYKVRKIQYTMRGRKAGVNVTVEFVHEPSGGECYFYVAVWTAVKQGQ